MSTLEEELGLLRSIAAFDQVGQGMVTQEQPRSRNLPDPWAGHYGSMGWVVDEMKTWKRLADESLLDSGRISVQRTRYPGSERRIRRNLRADYAKPKKIDRGSPHVAITDHPFDGNYTYLEAACAVCFESFEQAIKNEDVDSFVIPEHDERLGYARYRKCSGSGVIAGYGVAGCFHCGTENHGKFTRKDRMEFTCYSCRTPNIVPVAGPDNTCATL